MAARNSEPHPNLKELKINICKIQTITPVFKLAGKVRYKGPLCTEKPVKKKGTPLRTWREREKQTKLNLASTQASHSQVLLALAWPFLATVSESRLSFLSYVVRFYFHDIFYHSVL